MATHSEMVDAVQTVTAAVYPIRTPSGTGLPFVVYQQVGGRAENFLGGGVGGKRNARFQFNAWASTQIEADGIMHSIEALLKAAPFFADAVGALVWRDEPTGEMYGSQQDFSVWLDA